MNGALDDPCLYSFDRATDVGNNNESLHFTDQDRGAGGLAFRPLLRRRTSDKCSLGEILERADRIWMAEGDFARKLDLVLKALSINRARLPADLGVTKSQVSRWLGGRNTPKAHNLASLTELIARRRPDFSLLHWEMSVEDLSATLCIASPRPITAATRTLDQIAFTLSPDAAENARTRGRAYEGIWRLTFSAGVHERPDLFAHSYSLTRRATNGLLHYRAGVFGQWIDGWSLPSHGQLFSMAVNSVTGSVSLVIFNGVTGERAELLDGLILSSSRDRGGVPTALACINERIFDLSDDAEADEARFQALVALPPVAPPGTVSEAIQKHILRDIGPAAAAAGGDLLMIMPALRGISR